MFVLQKYRLELHWGSIEYPQEDLAVLKGAYFTGPVLKNAAKINEEDQLILDLTTQHLIFVPDYYQGTLKWKGIEYRADKIFLKEASIKSKYINSIEPLRKNDFILIDCKKHEHNIHAFNLVYFAEVCKPNKERKY